jgi:aromatic ring-cleaving dioxygenase
MATPAHFIHCSYRTSILRARRSTAQAMDLRGNCALLVALAGFMTAWSVHMLDPCTRSSFEVSIFPTLIPWLMLNRQGWPSGHPAPTGN